MSAEDQGASMGPSVAADGEVRSEGGRLLGWRRGDGGSSPLAADPVDPAAVLPRELVWQAPTGSGDGGRPVAEWGWSVPGGLPVVEPGGEVEARRLAACCPGSVVYTRVVGPWVAADPVDGGGSGG